MRLLLNNYLLKITFLAMFGLVVLSLKTKENLNIENANMIEMKDSINQEAGKNPTFRQRMLRAFYPTIRKLGKKGKNGTVLENTSKTSPITSFHDLYALKNNGDTIKFADFKGKKVMLVNTASDCGYTGQYAELQQLHEKYGDKLAIIAFPANDFANQEKGSDKDIAQFCQLNYGVTFPVAKKGSVVIGNEQQPVFKWLSSKASNGWNDHAPDWNFGKYLVDENGVLTNYYGPSVSPLEDQVLKAVN